MLNSIATLSALALSTIAQVSATEPVPTRNLHLTYDGDHAIVQEAINRKELASVEFIGCYTTEGEIRIDKRDEDTQDLLSIVWTDPQVEASVLAMPCESPTSAPNSWYKDPGNQPDFEAFETILADRFYEDGSWSITNPQMAKDWDKAVYNNRGVIFTLRVIPRRY